jgi:hypothetical protein
VLLCPAALPVWLALFWSDAVLLLWFEVEGVVADEFWSVVAVLLLL